MHNVSKVEKETGSIESTLRAVPGFMRQRSPELISIIEVPSRLFVV